MGSKMSVNFVHYSREVVITVVVITKFDIGLHIFFLCLKERLPAETSGAVMCV